MRSRWVWVPVMFLIPLSPLLPTSLRSASATEAEIPVPLANAVTDALGFWAQLTTTGDSTALDSVFVVGGPQHRLLDEESSAWDGTASPEPLRFTVRELRLRSSGAERATVWASIEATRVGFESRIV